MTLIGTFKVSIPTATFATSGVILSAAYALWLYRKVIFGVLKPSLAGIKDLTFREGLIWRRWSRSPSCSGSTRSRCSTCRRHPCSNSSTTTPPR